MINLSILFVGFLLGAYACAILGILLVAHRPHYTPTTMHRRKNRDAYVPPVPPQWEREEGGVDYKWLGMTGSEQE
jgi:hypothetical protein